MFQAFSIIMKNMIAGYGNGKAYGASAGVQRLLSSKRNGCGTPSEELKKKGKRRWFRIIRVDIFDIIKPEDHTVRKRFTGMKFHTAIFTAYDR